MQNQLLKSSIASCGLLILVSCGSSSPTSLTADKPSGVMGAISAAVAITGSSMNGTGLTGIVLDPRLNNSIGPFAYTTAQECDVHAQALNPSNATQLSQSDPDFPGRTIYCLMAYNTGSPDSVQGGFAIVKSISCMVEAQMAANGIGFDGASHTITATPSSDCFSATQLSNVGGSPMTVTMTPSSPAAFNSHFDRGIQLTISGFGSYSFGARTSTAGVIEFISMEDQAPGATNKTGVYEGMIDANNGILRFEGRSDRYSGANGTDSTACNGGSCGWSRHDRVYAEITVSDATSFTVTGLKSGGKVSAAHSDVSQSSGYSGWLATVDGNLTTGIKARMYQSSNGSGGAAASTADLSNPTKYTEVTNTRCYTSSSNSAGTCGTGIAKPSVTTFPFALLGTYTSSNSFFTTSAGLTYTTVDPTQDVQ